MKTRNLKSKGTQLLTLSALLTFAVATSGCFMTNSLSPQAGSATATGIAGAGGSAGASGVAGAGGTAGAGSGAGAEGATTISSSVPNGNSILFRIQNALTLPPATATSAANASLVSFLTSTNFKAAALQQTPDLSGTSNPITASGSSAVPILAFAACADVKPTSYSAAGFGTTTTALSAATAAQQTALVSAGLTIVNQCTAGLAASGTTLGTQVSAVFSGLVGSASAAATLPATATIAQAFVAVCTAATTFCTSMTSF